MQRSAIVVLANEGEVGGGWQGVGSGWEVDGCKRMMNDDLLIKKQFFYYYSNSTLPGSVLSSDCILKNRR